MQLTANAICGLLGGTLEGNPDVVVTQPSKIEEGGEGTITFLANPKYESYLYKTTASIILVDEDFKPNQPITSTIIRVKNVYTAIATLLKHIETLERPLEGISSLASIHASANLDNEIYVGEFSVISAGVKIGCNSKIHPQVFIGQGVTIGSNVIVHTGAKIYANCQIGNECIIHANAVIGSDGFGFAPQNDGSYKKITHVGNVIIKDNVEIGANTTIDRATFASTVIHEGVKIDNLVQIAHNVEIGANTVIAAQTGIAGSTKIGKNCRIGGQVGFAGHINIADGTQIQAQSGISGDITEENSKWFGSPAIPYNNYVRSYTVFKQLPELYRTLNRIEKKLKE
jgi:UDP-3-O-[3-hydroxymyristoyl] glucosamine N-acyltransferase